MNSYLKAVLFVMLSMFLNSHVYAAAVWVCGKVSSVEDYSVQQPGAGVSVDLNSSTSYSRCTYDNRCGEKFSFVVGQGGVTADYQKRVLALVTVAYSTGKVVRVHVPDDSMGPRLGYCYADVIGLTPY